MNLPDAIARQYELNPESCQLLQDTDDLVYRVTDDRQQSYAIKIQRKKSSHASEILDLCNWLSFLAENVFFTVPFPLHNLNGSLCSQITDNRQVVYDFVIYQWVDGKPIKDDLNQKNIGKIGRAIAELHNASAQYYRNANTLVKYDCHWVTGQAET